jgi:hypothetical protein
MKKSARPVLVPVPKSFSKVLLFKFRPAFIRDSRSDSTMRDRKSNPDITPTPYQFEPVLNSREMAPLLRMHYKTLEEKARNGEVPAAKPNGEWLFRLSKMDLWLNQQLDSNVTNHAALTKKESIP